MLLKNKVKSFLLSSFVLLVATQVSAQEIKSASFASPEASLGGAVDLSIVFQTTGGSAWCGMLVECW